MPRTNVLFIPREGDDGAAMAQRFHKLCIKAGTYKDAKRKAHYVKPSLAKRTKSLAARKKARKAALKASAWERPD